MCPSTRSPAVRKPAAHSRAASLTPTLVALVFAAGPAAAEPCKLGQLAELPVTMEGMRPLVHAAINGKDALFIADSGAFFSALSVAAAKQFDLRPDTLWGVRAEGVGGSTQMGLATVKTFRIFNMDLHNIPFYVLGNDFGSGTVGLLGQNVFRLGDVEYDLANGMITILRTHGDCHKTSLAYWANAKQLPYSEIDIDFATRERPNTTGEAYVNGNKIHVMFDTGAGASMLTLRAAKRAGITPESPGVTPAGAVWGVGHHRVRTWIAPFASFRIGDEQILNTHLRIGDDDLPESDMLIGPDFFLSHHVLVASSQRRLYFTYNGGPVFNLTNVPMPAAAAGSATADASPPGAPAETGDATGRAQAEQLDAAGYARRGSASASRREYEPALADLTRAIELDPGNADYFYERGRAYASDQKADQALEDFGQAIRLKADDVPALMARAEIRARRNEPTGAISADLDAADHAAPKQADMRLELGALYQRVRNYPAAIAQCDDWINSHPDDIRMPIARNARCRARALEGKDLDRALDDCNFAVRKDPKAAAHLDSRGLVYLRQARYDKAIADYDAALAMNPKIAWSLYGRGIARQHLGQAAAGQADIDAATALFPKIAEEAASHGIGP